MLAEFMSAGSCTIQPSGGIEMDECMSCCIRWNNGILEVFSCGEWTPVPGGGPGGTQTPPQGSPQPAPGGCEEFFGTVKYGGKYLLPVPVSEGDEITVTNCLGAWTGFINDFDIWYCGDGLIFFAGGCIEGTQESLTDDLLLTANHNALLAHIGDTYYDCGDAANSLPVTIVVPSGVSAANMTFLANSASLIGDGSMNFAVRVCKGTAAPFSLSYVSGSGPSTAAAGTVITVTSDGGSSFEGSTVYQARFTIDPCAKLTLISAPGWSLFNHDPSNSTYGDTPCGSSLEVFTTGDGYLALPDPWILSNHQEMLTISQTPFTMAVRVENV